MMSVFYHGIIHHNSTAFFSNFSSNARIFKIFKKRRAGQDLSSQDLWIYEFSTWRSKRKGLSVLKSWSEYVLLIRRRNRVVMKCKFYPSDVGPFQILLLYLVSNGSFDLCTVSSFDF